MEVQRNKIAGDARVRVHHLLFYILREYKFFSCKYSVNDLAFLIVDLNVC